MKSLNKDLYEKCIKNEIKLPSDEVQAKVECGAAVLQFEKDGKFDTEKSYNVSSFPFLFSQSRHNNMGDPSLLPTIVFARKVWVS